jgi:hypothetical protein
MDGKGEGEEREGRRRERRGEERRGEESVRKFELGGLIMSGALLSTGHRYRGTDV